MKKKDWTVRKEETLPTNICIGLWNVKEGRDFVWNVKY
jgi:hypothetical protein